jgi:outer membrane protein TolC
MIDMYKRLIFLILIFLLTIGVFPGVAAAELSGSSASQPEGITIEQAVNRALDYSKTVKGAELSIERTKETYDAASKKSTYTPTGPTSDAAISVFTGLISANISWTMAGKTKNAEEQKLALSVFNTYINVLKANENMDYAKEAMKNAQMQWNTAIISSQLGVLSQYQKNIVETKFKTAQNTLQTTKIAYNTAHEALNLLLGYTAETRAKLIETPAYSSLEIGSLEEEQTNAISNSTSVWQLDQAAYLAFVSLNLFDWSSTTSYRTKEIDLDKANLSAAEAREQLKQKVRDLHNSILSNETSYSTQLDALNQSTENLIVKKLMYEIGMATSTDVNTAELELANLKKSLNATIYQHEYLKLCFAKPWI